MASVDLIESLQIVYKAESLIAIARVFFIPVIIKQLKEPTQILLGLVIILNVHAHKIIRRGRMLLMQAPGFQTGHNHKPKEKQRKYLYWYMLFLYNRLLLYATIGNEEWQYQRESIDFVLVLQRNSFVAWSQSSPSQVWWGRVLVPIWWVCIYWWWTISTNLFQDAYSAENGLFKNVFFFSKLFTKILIFPR